MADGSKFTGPHRNSNHTDGSRRWFSNLPIGNDPDYVVFYDDFVGYFDTNKWEVVKDTGASVALVADSLNGELLLSSAGTTDDDGSLIQIDEEFVLLSAKKMWFEAKVKVADADQMDVFVGLSTVNATNPEAVLTNGDRVGFQINDGDASILCKTEKNGTETSTDSGVDAADATYVQLGIYFDGVTVQFFVNRNWVATHTANIVNDENIAPVLFELSGNATGTKTMTADYVFCVTER